MNKAYIPAAIAFVALVTLPLWMSGVYYINVASQILFYAIFALGLNVLVGYAGLVSLGHAGLFGIAAYATGYMLTLGYGHAAAIIVAHNHPSGDPTPSRADIAMTRDVANAARALGIAVHDHLVIGRGGHASFKSLGLL